MLTRQELKKFLVENHSLQIALVSLAKRSEVSNILVFVQIELHICKASYIYVSNKRRH